MGLSEGGSVPEACDCCGHDAEDCGMLEDGWIRDSQLLATDAVFCRSCAHLLHIARHRETCLWCGTPMIGEEAAEARGWAYFTDGLGDLHPCCPGCLATHFGITARVSLGGDQRH